MEPPADSTGKTLPRRDSDLSTHSNSRRRLTRSWSGASGGSGGGSEPNLLLPPGVRPPSATRVRQRQGIAMPPIAPEINVKSGPTAEEKAAVAITAAAKGHVARKQVRELKTQAAEAKREEQRQRAEAATKIASAARGRAARKQVDSIKKDAQARKLEADRAAKEAALRAQEAEALAREAAAKRAAQEAADAAIREAILREKNEAEAKAELARKTAELNEEINNLQASVRERDRQLLRLKGDMSNQLTQLSKKDATIDELLIRIKELEAEIVHLKEMMTLAEQDVNDSKKREGELTLKIKNMQKPPMKVRWH